MPAAVDAPNRLRVIRARGVLVVEWQSGEKDEYSLQWLRENCPCATCRTQRETTAEESDPLALSSKPPPSAQVDNLETVGGYAFRFTWADGHNTGIYSFAWLLERRQEGAA